MLREWSLLALAMVHSVAAEAATYRRGCGALPRNWITPKDRVSEHAPIMDLRVRRKGVVTFNDQRVSQDELAAFFKRMADLVPRPILHVRFDPTVDCATVKSLRDFISKGLNCDELVCAEGTGSFM